jgi:hypothetical protein
VSAPAHPYANKRIGLATIHAKELAIGPPFRRLLDAEIVVAPKVDTDILGTFSGEIPRNDELIRTAVVKAEMAFATLDVDCAIASEGSYGPIERVPLNPAGVEIMAFVDRKRGVKIVETLLTHRTNWRMWRLKPGDPLLPVAIKTLRFPEYGIFVMKNSDYGQPVKGLKTVDEVVAAVDREARRSDDGLALMIADMRAHMNPTRMKVLRALGWKLAKRLAHVCPKCGAPGFGFIDSRRGLPCVDCGQPTHYVHFEIDGCNVCGHAVARPRKDGLTVAPKLACQPCRHPEAKTGAAMAIHR